MYINIHTHLAQPTDDWFLQNFYTYFNQTTEVKYCSAGLHPWLINEESWKEDFALLSNTVQAKNILAIGECGLDKVCATDFNLQVKVFVQHIHLANEINKPLILHCVRAYDDILLLLKKEHNKVPVIFHGFNRNETIAKKIIEAGYYLSFGKAILKKEMQELLSKIPVDRFLLETDDSEISIRDIYQTAAKAFQIDEDSLSLQLFKNASVIFGAEVLKV